MKNIKKKRMRSGTAGFTLVELMVVISIIAILATIVGVNVMGNIDDSAQKSAAAQIKNFKTAIVSYRLKNRSMPNSLQDLLPFLDAKEIPKDPWGNDYVYEKGGDEGFVITCLGRDGSRGGSEYDMDISSDNLQAIQ
jgi:general secretion pathway protein G